MANRGSQIIIIEGTHSGPSTHTNNQTRDFPPGTIIRTGPPGSKPKPGPPGSTRVRGGPSILKRRGRGLKVVPVNMDTYRHFDVLTRGIRTRPSERSSV